MSNNVEFLSGIQNPKDPYIILKHEYHAILQLAVNHLLRLGYCLSGVLFHNGKEYVQAMLDISRLPGRSDGEPG
jgi:hypothetical protein